MKGKIYCFNGKNEDIEFGTMDELREKILSFREKYADIPFVNDCIAYKFVFFTNEVIISRLSQDECFAPGQTYNINFKRAVFNENGVLHTFDGVRIKKKDKNAIY